MKFNKENLKEMVYNSNTKKWRKHLSYNYYIFKPFCKICGHPYLTSISKPGDFCSPECGFKGHIKDLTGERFGRLLVIKLIGRNKKRIYIWLCKCDCGNIKEVPMAYLTSGHTKSCGCLKKNWFEERPLYKGIIKNNIPLYDTYAYQIDWCEEVRRDPIDNDLLQVKCFYSDCRKWHTPKLTDVKRRIMALNDNITGEQHFYCSDECKKLCPIFWKVNYQAGHPKSQDNYRPYQKEWSDMVLEAANYKCEICGSNENLIAHHIKPVKTHPHLQADVDNGVCLCRECNSKYGHPKGTECSTGNLAKLVCNY